MQEETKRGSRLGTPTGRGRHEEEKKISFLDGLLVLSELSDERGREYGTVGSGSLGRFFFGRFHVDVLVGRGCSPFHSNRML